MLTKILSNGELDEVDEVEMSLDLVHLLMEI
jgi:hypothetical protein